MRIVDLQDAKTHLSELVDLAAAGEPFVIAKAGKPLIRVVPFVAPMPGERSRIGFMAGRLRVPDDFDDLGRETIEERFEGR